MLLPTRLKLGLDLLIESAGKARLDAEGADIIDEVAGNIGWSTVSFHILPLTPLNITA